MARAGGQARDGGLAKTPEKMDSASLAQTAPDIQPVPRRRGEEKFPVRIAEVEAGEFDVRNHWFRSSDWMGKQAPPVWKQAAWTLYNPASIATLRRIQSEYPAEAWIVHNVFPVGSAGIYREALHRRIPIIYFINNFRPFSVSATLWVKGRVEPAALRGNMWPEILNATWQHSLLKSALMAAVLKTAFKLHWFDSIKTWVACSDFMRRIFIEAGIPEERAFTLRYSYKPQPRVEPAAEGGFYFFIGRLVAEKGVATLLQAWEILKARLGGAAPKLVITGTGDLAELCRRAARENEHVDYIGKINEERKAELFATCRAVIVPSVWWEPLGIIPYEAFDSEKPVLAAASGGLVESVLHGETGLLHEPGNASQLADHVQEFESHPGRRREMGLRGREWLVAISNEEPWRAKFREIVEYAVAHR